MTALYNEYDPYAAAWLDNLAAAGHIAPGTVDTRSIVDLRPADVAGYRQFHAFAGIAGWSLALRLAGVSDDCPVWTGSCPCQPFSAAGQRKGFDDERHLWPAWFRLIRECRPAIVFGEQVEAAVRLGWLDAVFSDLEGEGYACGAVVLGAHSVGAPHSRQRLWFVAHAEESGRRRDDQPVDGSRRDHGTATRLARSSSAAAGCGRSDGGLADTNGRHASTEGLQRGGQYGQQPQDRLADLWTDAKWLPCRDGKARPVEPGTFPLAHGAPARVGRLRAYGNAIVPQVAAAFIAAAMDSLPQLREAA